MIDYRVEIDNRIEKYFTQEKYFQELFEEAGGGGKRLRPILTMMVYDLFATDNNRERALDLALSCELTHTASLLLDDVIDFDRIRRGKPTAHQKYGLIKAVLAGVDMPTLALNIAMEAGGSVANMAICNTWKKMCEGVYIELYHNGSDDIYFDIIDRKTAELFSLSAFMGLIPTCIEFSVNGEFEINKAMQSFGLHLGRAYQIADDLVDLGYIRDGINDDRVREGSEHLLLQRLNIIGIQDLVDALLDGSITDAEFTELSGKFDIIQDAIMSLIVNEFVEMIFALDIITIDPEPLIEFAHYCVNAMLTEGGFLTIPKVLP